MHVGREKASKELDRLAPRGGSHWYGESAYPPDLRVCPSRVIAKGDKVRVARDWPNALYPLNSVLANFPAQYGAMGEFSSFPTPGAGSGGIDLQDCLLHWAAAPSR